MLPFAEGLLTLGTLELRTHDRLFFQWGAPYEFLVVRIGIHSSSIVYRLSEICKLLEQAILDEIKDSTLLLLLTVPLKVFAVHDALYEALSYKLECLITFT